MYCPLCGAKLVEVNRKDPTDDWEFDDPRWNDYIEDPDNSIWFKCISCNSFGDSFPLQMHHPLGGINSKPGDSWSLSWVK